MPITLQWDDAEKTRLLLRFDGKWTWEEMYEMIQTIHQHIEGVPHTVHLLMEWSKSGTVPLNALSHARNMMANKRHPRSGISVMIGINGHIKTMWDVFMKLYGAQFRGKHSFGIVNTIEEARAFIERETTKENRPS